MSHHPCLTEPFLPFQLPLLPGRQSAVMCAQLFLSTAPEMETWPSIRARHQTQHFLCPVPTHGQMLHNHPQEMFPQPLSLPCSHSELPGGSNPEPNLLILFPVAADQAPFPSVALACLCKPSPAAWLITKHLLPLWWRQS